jgi:hypothetical protein
MKNLTLLATTLLLTNVNVLPALADGGDGKTEIALVETSDAKPAGIRLFHSKKKLALKQEAQAAAQASEAVPAYDGSLSYGTDSFIITN